MYEPNATGVVDIAILEFISFVLITTSPLFLLFYWIAYEYYGASITSSAVALLSQGPIEFFFANLPKITILSAVVYLCWVAVQAVLFILLPGRIHYGPRTCGGRQLPYKLNGLLAWFITIGVAAIASYYEIIDPSFIARHWGELLVAANVYTAALIVIFKIKAHIKPDNKGETLFTGHFWYDLFNGGELHPRTGTLFDWKHFNASRTGGILLWTLIDLSFAALQYQSIGNITISMVLAVVFRAIIVIEYFYYENWFFETLDGAHEHFSFYNIYGFAAMMPHIWTLQTQYLAVHPVELSIPRSILIVLMFTAGWALNHVANDQKSTSRRTGGKCQIWGEDARFIEATYETIDGKKHSTLLLCSGWWGVVRHANYVGSCLYTWASCLPCGSTHIFPYTEAIVMTLMCLHRCLRDEARCKVKYGAAWDEYCRRVKWRMIPGIF